MIFETTVPPFIKGLKNINAILAKAVQFADSKKFEFDVLMNARLAPDQFPLVRQVQIMCDTAKLATSRLTGTEAPSHPDTEKTYAEIKARVESTIAYLEKFTAKDFAESAKRHITQARWEGQYLTGDEFVHHHALPNFYFHMTATYEILRHNGLDIGKKDYLGAMPFHK